MVILLKNCKTFLFFYNMKERIINFKRGTNHKKYKAIIENKKSGKKRTLQFGDNRYEQYKDSTGLGLYTHKNHSDLQRRRNYFNRHSGVSSKSKALDIEIKKSKGVYTPKILSHKYLW